MKRNGILLSTVFSVCLFVSSSFAQTIAIRAARLIDGHNDKPFENVTLLVEKNRIVSLGKDLAVPANATIVDLGNKTVLPGFIDAHTHIMSVGGEDYGAELYKNSIPYRAICAVASARKALWRGFTAMRDVESEGTMYADVDLKRAIDAGIVPGPRLWVSTRGLNLPGRYYPEDYSWELGLPKGVQMVSGMDECVRAVREQVAHGADWIKIYVDWRPYNITDDGKISALTNFTQEELVVMIRETHRLGRKVAVHAVGHEGIKAALDSGADSLEWGSDRPKSFRCFRLAVCCRSEAALYWLLGILLCFRGVGVERFKTRLRKTGRIGHTKASVRAENIRMWLGLNSLYRSGPDQQAVV